MFSGTSASPSVTAYQGWHGDCVKYAHQEFHRGIVSLVDSW